MADRPYSSNSGAQLGRPEHPPEAGIWPRDAVRGLSVDIRSRGHSITTTQ